MLGSRHKGDMVQSQSWEGQGREAEGLVGIKPNRNFWKHWFVHLYLCGLACPMMLGNGALVLRDSVCAGWTGTISSSRAWLSGVALPS